MHSFSFARLAPLTLGTAIILSGCPNLVLADAAPAAPGRLASLRDEARIHEHGEGVARNTEKAVQLYCEASRLGDAESQYNLGWMFAMGRGVPRDDNIAAYLFDMASRQGDPHAQRMLKLLGTATPKQPECLAEEDDGDFPSADSADHRRIHELVHKLAPEYGISPRLALAVIRAESNFNPSAVSPKNAKGLMQLIPETAARFNVKKPFDPEQNIRGGLSYLRWLLAYFKGNVSLVVAAYNAGEGAVNRYAGVPPYAETVGYVKRINEYFKREQHPFDPSITQPSPEMPRINSRKST